MLSEGGAIFQDIPAARGSLGLNYVIYGNNSNPGIVQLPTSSADIVPQDFGISHNPGFRSVALIDDINGDHVEDLMLGDPSNSLVYISYGKVTHLNFYEQDNGFIIQGEASNDFLGWSIGEAGDFNHDGNNDMIMSTLFSNKVYIIFGSFGIRKSKLLLKNLLSSEGLIISASYPYNSFGMKVASAGDFNGDGNVDIAISAKSTSQSFIFIIFGNATLPSRISLNTFKGPLLTIEGGTTDFPGIDMATLHDINGDGIDDFIIGSISRVGQNSGLQKSYVLYGDRSLTYRSKLSLDEFPSPRGFSIIGGGLMVAGVGDINGDGLNDIMVNTFTGWQGQSASYLMVFPYPLNKSPSLSPTVLPTIPPAGSFSPSLVPTLIPSRQPQTLAPSSKRPTRFPTIKPSLIPSRDPSVRPTLNPSREFLSPSSLPSVYPTIAIKEFNVIVNITKAGFYYGNWTRTRIRINSPQNVVITASPNINGPNIFIIYPQPNMTITFTDFSLLSIIDLSLFFTPSSFDSMSYQTSPLIILLPNDQRIIFENINEFTLTSRNFIFSMKKNTNNNDDSFSKMNFGASVVYSEVFSLLTGNFIFFVCLILVMTLFTCWIYRKKSDGVSYYLQTKPIRYANILPVTVDDVAKIQFRHEIEELQKKSELEKNSKSHFPPPSSSSSSSSSNSSDASRKKEEKKQKKRIRKLSSVAENNGEEVEVFPTDLKNSRKKSTLMSDDDSIDVIKGSSTSEIGNKKKKKNKKRKKMKIKSSNHEDIPVVTQDIDKDWYDDRRRKYSTDDYFYSKSKEEEEAEAFHSHSSHESPTEIEIEQINKSSDYQASSDYYSTDYSLPSFHSYRYDSDSSSDNHADLMISREPTTRSSRSSRSSSSSSSSSRGSDRSDQDRFVANSDEEQKYHSTPRLSSISIQLNSSTNLSPHTATSTPAVALPTPALTKAEEKKLEKQREAFFPFKGVQRRKSLLLWKEAQQEKQKRLKLQRQERKQLQQQQHQKQSNYLGSYGSIAPPTPKVIAPLPSFAVVAAAGQEKLSPENRKVLSIRLQNLKSKLGKQEDRSKRGIHRNMISRTRSTKQLTRKDKDDDEREDDDDDDSSAYDSVDDSDGSFANFEDFFQSLTEDEQRYLFNTEEEEYDHHRRNDFGDEYSYSSDEN